MTSRWLAVAPIVAVVAACGGANPPAGASGVDLDGVFSTPQPGGEEGSSNGGPDGAGGQGDTGAPVQATVDGVTFGYRNGRCEIRDGAAQAQVVSADGRGAINLIVAPSEADLPYAMRQTSVVVLNGADVAPGPFSLSADVASPGTTWEATITGTDVEVVGRLREFASGEFSDVTIRIPCDQETIGTGGPETGWTGLQPSNRERIAGSVMVDLDGTRYQIAYLSVCSLFGDTVAAEGSSNDAEVSLQSQPAGIGVNLAIGDSRDHDSVVRWALGPDVSLQDGLVFEGSGTSRSWTGELVAADGTTAQTTITVTCDAGDTYVAAGTATVVLDGVTHILDRTDSCDINGTEIYFLGREGDDGIAIAVIGGGSRIAFGDESGNQTLTWDVVFEVSGQQATWTGILGSDRQATVSIDCR